MYNHTPYPKYSPEAQWFSLKYTSELHVAKYSAFSDLETKPSTRNPKSLSNIELLLIFTPSSHVSTQQRVSGEMFFSTKGCCLRKRCPWWEYSGQITVYFGPHWINMLPRVFRHKLHTYLPLISTGIILHQDLKSLPKKKVTKTITGLENTSRQQQQK